MVHARVKRHAQVASLSTIFPSAHSNAQPHVLLVAKINDVGSGELSLKTCDEKCVAIAIVHKIAAVQ